MSKQPLPSSQPPCHCQSEVKEWKVKYTKLEEKRGALRQAVKLLEQQIDKVQAENVDLKRANEQERAHIKKEEKDGELALRVSLENEISSLKSQITSLQHSASGAADGNGKVCVLEEKLAVEKKEINRLKELLKKEKTRADSEKKNAESEKRRANEAWRIVTAEKSKADEDKKILERQIEEQKLLVEALKKEADEMIRKFCPETSKYIEANKKLELEKHRLKKETRRADTEKARAEEQRKLVEVTKKQLTEERCRANNLSRKVEESNSMIEKLQKELFDLSRKISDRTVGDVNSMQHRTVEEAVKQQLEAEKQKLLSETKQADSEMRKADEKKNLVKKYKKRSLEEKCRVDQLIIQLNVERQRNKDLQQQLGQSSRKQVEAPAGLSPRMKILKKKLKLQKEKVKHAKELAQLERLRHSSLLRELQRMKLDFGQIFRRLNMLDTCSISSFGGIDEFEKNRTSDLANWKKRSRGLQSLSDELVKPYMAFAGDPTCGGSSIDFISGTNSKLKLPRGGSPRKKLKRSGIDSALASFSDRGSVGSQDKGDITVSTPARLLEDHLNQLADVSLHLDGNNRNPANENMAVVSENSVKCPLAIDGDGVHMHGQKRKRWIEVDASIDDMSWESRKLHLQIEEKLSASHDMPIRQMDRPIGDGGCLADNDPHTQQRFENEMSHEGKLDHATMYLDSQWKNEEDSKNQSNLVPCGQAIDGAHVSVKEGKDWQSPFGNDIEGISELLGEDYMKLLELDDSSDERLFQVAIERPLSPTLPEINMDYIEAIDFDRDVNKHQRVHCPVEDLSPPMEPELNNMIVDSGKLSFVLSESEGAKFDNQQERQHGIFPRHFIGGCDAEDLESISRILCATKSCMVRSPISNSGWSLKRILIELNMEDKLPAKDKASVLLSILLRQSSAITALGLPLSRDTISDMDSFTGHIHDVISDVEARSLLAKICSIDELLGLIEDFLLEGKLILCSEMSSEELITCDRGSSLVLEGVNFLISSEAASANLLVAGSVVLAALCAAANQIDFICEASYRIFCNHGSDSSPVLTILHVFAHICGGNYFSSRSYSLLMTVLKSFVLFLEGAGDAASSVCVLPLEETTAELSECPKCPFSYSAVSLDLIVPLLLEALQGIVTTGEVHSKVVGLITATQNGVPLSRDDMGGVKGLEDVECLGDGRPDSLCIENSWRSTSELDHLLGINLYNDVFLLVELIAFKLGWEWTKTKILPQLLKILESCLQERSAAAIIILVGQLGRLGVDSSGFDDLLVESLRCNLYSVLCQACRSNLSFPIQCAIVMALLPLIPLDFENVLGSNAVLPDTSSISVPARAVGTWFSCLSEEEKGSVFTLLRPTIVNRS